MTPPIHLIMDFTLAWSPGDLLKPAVFKAFMFHRQLTPVKVIGHTYSDRP
jgi:hypothetical protein